GLAEHAIERLEYIIEIALEAGPRNGGRVHGAASFNLSGTNFQVVVELIAGLRLGSTRAPDFPVHVQHSDLVRGFRTRSATDACGAIDDREFMVFLQKDHHAVRQLETLGLLRVKCGQGRNRDLLPIGGLGCSSRGYRAEESHNRKENERTMALHCAPPSWSAAAVLVSIIPAVRLVGTKV